MQNIGESWEISGYEGCVSVVSNGYLAGNQLDELIEVYMGELVGDSVYDRFGLEFPLLFKLIDADENLSIQVHPNDEVAGAYNAMGKTEMWVVLHAEPGAKIVAGFKKQTDKSALARSVENGGLCDFLCDIEVHAGDVIFVPAGRIHSICKGVMVAEIQQNSDLTFRLYDYDRIDATGKKRDLHVEQALEAIDYAATPNPVTHPDEKMNGATNLVQCSYFTTNMICFNRTIQRDYALLDSFVTYICTEGAFEVETRGGKALVNKGESVLIPNSLEQVTLRPKQRVARLIETYVN